MTTLPGRPARLLFALGLLWSALLVSRESVAQTVDTSQWRCETCPFRKSAVMETTSGALYVGGADAGSGRYTGLDDDEGRLEFGVDGRWRDEAGRYAEFTVEGLGLPTTSARTRYGREGRFDVTLRYDSIPWRRYELDGTPFSGTASLTLPRDWVPAITTDAMTRLPAALLGREIRSDRDAYGLAARYLVGQRWTLFADWTQQRRNGTAGGYASFLNSAMQLPAPIDHITDGFEAGAVWEGDRGSLRVAYSGSVFRNRDTSVTFQNPYLPVLPAAATGRMALAPDNESHQFGLSGHRRFAFWNTSLSGTAVIGRMTQDDALLPVSTAAGASPPQAGLDGKVDIARYGLTISSRPLKGLSLRGTARYDERDDRTVPVAVDYVVTDTFSGGTDLDPRHGYERTRLEGSADYTLFPWLRIGGTGIWDEVQRVNQDVRKTVDDGGHFRVRLLPFDALSVTLKAGLMHREASGFDLSAIAPGENPLLRKYNLANRDRWLQEAAVSWNVSDAVTLALQGRSTKDSYRRSPLGLNDGRTSSGDVDLGWTVSDTLRLHARASYQEVTSKQLGQARPSGSAWELRNDEEFWSLGAGLESRWAAKWSLRGDVAYTKSIGDQSLITSGTADPYPRARMTQTVGRLALRYQASPALAMRLRVAFSSGDEDDWLRDGVGPATVPNLLAFGARADRYDAVLVGLSFDYQFGKTVVQTVADDEAED